MLNNFMILLKFIINLIQFPFFYFLFFSLNLFFLKLFIFFFLLEFIKNLVNSENICNQLNLKKKIPAQFFININF